jgi:hypothetical protein
VHFYPGIWVGTTIGAKTKSPLTGRLGNRPVLLWVVPAMVGNHER